MHSPGPKTKWSRRDVLRGAASLAAVSPLRAAMSAGNALRAPVFAYVGSADQKGDPESGQIHVFSVRGQSWSRLQVVSSRAPASMVLSPSQHILYVANDVEMHEALPRGSVEAYAIHPLDGTLRFMGRQSLSLSATHPRCIAISREGDMLAVAAYGGGVYNLLPVASDGSLGKPAAIFKETGSGPHIGQDASHPHTLLFDPELNHQLLTSDLGNDHVSLFDVANQKFMRTAQRKTSFGGGPGSVVLHPNGSKLYVWHQLSSALTCHPLNRCQGMIGAASQQFDVSTQAGCLPGGQVMHHGLAMHPSGRMLYAALGGSAEVHAWSIAESDCTIQEHRTISVQAVSPTSLIAAADGQNVFLLDPIERSIVALHTDIATGRPGISRKVAHVKDPSALVFKTL